jgi:hypothetical protein
VKWPRFLKIRVSIGRVLVAIALAALPLTIYLPSLRNPGPDPLSALMFRHALPSFLLTSVVTQFFYWIWIPTMISVIRTARARKREARHNLKESDPIEAQNTVEF